MKTYICTSCSDRNCVVAVEKAEAKPTACPYDFLKVNWHKVGKVNFSNKQQEK